MKKIFIKITNWFSSTEKHNEEVKLFIFVCGILFILSWIIYNQILLSS
jgi:hypothetical protein